MLNDKTEKKNQLYRKKNKKNRSKPSKLKQRSQTRNKEQ
jgi:hypothetical protein